MRLKRLLWYLALAFLIFFLIEAPAEAARVVKTTGETAGEWLGTAALSLSTFIKSLI